jgi:uncharacterized membrane protein
MNYIFHSNNKWFLHPEDLPVKPELMTDNDGLVRFQQQKRVYDNTIADIKAKALKIANPEICPQNMSQVKEGEFYQWPAEVTIENNKAILKL